MKLIRHSSITTAVAITAIIGVPNIGLADPVIDSITLSENSEMIIFGSGFTSKNHAAPLYYFDFENNNLSQNTKYSHLSSLVTANGITTSETTPTGVGNSMRWRVSQDYRALPIPEIDFNSNQLYVYFHRRYNFSISDSSTWGSNGFNLKTNRLWADTKNNIYIGYQGKEGNSSGRVYPEYTADGGAVWTGSRLPQVQNTWSQEEIVYQSGDIGVKNGRFDLIRDGSPAHDQPFRMRTSSYSEPYDQLVFDQITDQTPSDKYLYIYFDNIYIDDSFHRVYVSEAASFLEAKQRLIQVPSEWQDNRIVAYFDPGSYSPSNLYVYVVDAQGRANSNGIRICQSDCPSPPNPPPSVGVQ
ncbi:hypothetical protein [Marinobacter mobilis]|uniref:Uncharacterized protein n=1 Tax=Marinobacter mobilis TaxID=488533 RepID=A0A1H2UVK8_9GAMM|nr:hypothetical protein [Marinobacter mobilis]SDW60105.1 hypothetical protein SAMN04487960_103242 [Marinobacter mobilis]